MFGGAEVQIRALAKELAKVDGADVHVMVAGTPAPQPEVIDGVSVWTPLAWDSGALSRLTGFVRFVGRTRADVIVQRTISPYSTVIALLCRLRGIRFVYMVANDGETDGTHPVYRRFLSGRFARLAFRLAHAVIVQNEYQQEHAAAISSSAPALVPSSWPMPPGEVPYDEGSSVLWVSRIDRLYKRPELFLDLAERSPGERFVMIGAPANDQADYFEKVSGRASSMSNVEFVSGIPFEEIDRRYREAKVFINTSSSEGFPNTFLQAAANRTPIISLNIDPSSFIEKHSCGFYCHDDFALMEKRLRELLEDKTLRREQAENAYAYVRKHHDVRKNAAAFLSVLRQVTGVKRGSRRDALEGDNAHGPEFG